MGSIIILARIAVLVSLVGAAIWKLTHRNAFGSAVAGVFRVNRPRTTRILTTVVPLIELVVGVGIAIPGDVGSFAAVAAIVLFAAFSIVLLRIPDGSACGCWRETSFTERSAVRRNTSLVRNSILSLLCVSALRGGSEASYADLIFGAVAGGLVAVILLELPNVAAVALTAKADPIGTPL